MLPFADDGQKIPRSHNLRVAAKLKPQETFILGHNELRAGGHRTFEYSIIRLILGHIESLLGLDDRPMF